jgi:alkylation response protein AidB-like acyl-CoA dehydrogenase
MISAMTITAGDAGIPLFPRPAPVNSVWSGSALITFARWAAVQTLRGAGSNRDSPVQKWLRDAKLDEIGDGARDIMRLTVARSLFR